MKITRGRFQQILKEEVEAFLKQEAKEKMEEVELSESELEEMLDFEESKDARIQKATHKGKTYSASASTMKAITGGPDSPGKVSPGEFKAAAKQASSWAKDPEAVAGAARIVAKKKAGRKTLGEEDMDEAGKLSDKKLNKLLSQEDAIFTQEVPHKLIAPKK